MSNESKLNNNSKQISQKLVKVLKSFIDTSKTIYFYGIIKSYSFLSKYGALTTAEQKKEKNDKGDGEKKRRLIPKSKTEEQKKKKKKKKKIVGNERRERTKKEIKEIRKDDTWETNVWWWGEERNKIKKEKEMRETWEGKKILGVFVYFF
jgi:hypothetical protein